MTTSETIDESLCAAERWSVLGRTDSDVRQLVDDIVESTGLSWEQPDRRVDKRFAFPQLLTLSPISEGELMRPLGEPVHAVGRWLAERGLDFFHTQNLPFRRAVVSFETRDSRQTHLILNIAWSRFLRPGWYDSGGRFTHVVQPGTAEVPLAEIFNNN